MSYFHSGSLFCHPYILTTFRATLQFRCQKIYFGIAIHHWIYTPHVRKRASTPTTLCYQPQYDPLRIATDRLYFDPMCRLAVWPAVGKVSPIYVLSAQCKRPRNVTRPACTCTVRIALNMTVFAFSTRL